MRCQDEQKKFVLNVNFVDDSFFLNRIRDFERKYDMQWDQFLAEYSSGRLHAGRCNPEFAEWSLLCYTYMSELLKAGTGPPAKDSSAERQKPERDSGFFVFEESLCSTRNATSTRSRGCWEPISTATRSKLMA